MSEKKHFRCDVCGHTITEGHQEYYMTKITVNSMAQIDDGSAAGTEGRTDTYHVHNDFSNHCMGKLWNILEKQRN
jgi:hypothetical protein